MKGLNWSKVRLILAREIRDQLRDRRTLFMIAVLPMVLYPLLGMSLFQIAQFVREHPSRILIEGLPDLRNLPPLVKDGKFSAELFNDPSQVRLLEVTLAKEGAHEDAADRLATDRRWVQAGKYEAVVHFPPDFGHRLGSFHDSLLEPGAQTGRPAEPHVPDPIVIFNQDKEKSQIAQLRVKDVLAHWREAIGRQILRASNVPAAAASPFSVATDNVGAATNAKSAIWSKILPFLLLIWALTGAFYPAVDLCAGEKERGTLETLLSSPAERIEIVWGKLLTIMLFSMATAVLNLLSMGITGALVLTHIPTFGLPPMVSVVWLLIALVPVSALFGALCLALAAFARSTKEGQYYLMPLLLVTMPLTILTMAPGVDLNLGNSLIPITGVMLLLRVLLEGDYLAALPYVPLVAGMTLMCCLFAIRWAAEQFNSEEVLFRESERFDIGLWVRHLLRDRRETPTVAAALCCGLLILMLRFFLSLSVPMPQTFANFAVSVAITSLAVVATPPLLMTVFLTTSPRRTLLLRRPPLMASGVAILLALSIHPLVHVLQKVVQHLYPVNEQLLAQMSHLLEGVDSVWLLIGVVGIIPAICEELAFRGFILSGLRHWGHKWRAIVVSSIFFGVTHAIFQQSIIACAVGMVIGFIAVQTGSLMPCILFHAVHNSLAVASGYLGPLLSSHNRLLALLFESTSEGAVVYRWPLTLLSLLATVILLRWFHNLQYARSEEESLQEAIEHQSAHSWVG